jgi:carbonic anhydrase
MASTYTTDHAGSGRCGCAACATSQTGGRSWLRAFSRRRFVGAGLGAITLGGSMFPGVQARAQTTLAPAEALQHLMDGNERFVRGQLRSFNEDLAALKQANTAGQAPFAAVLSCADSRVPVELVFDQSIGQVFVTRVAGNIATPEIIASLEYGAAELGVRAMMVLAHQGCGAVKAAVAGKAVPGQISALYAPLRPAIERAGAGADVEEVAKANARIQADLLAKASPVLAELVGADKLKIVPAYYALATGKVTLLA